ncbi:hypothetical protein ACJIZ3_005166 [Penstemon smallii]|uniref:Pectinesterase inhibitor domain-containing protein n=1 Tax=Penstemon smallii TaxID=265156 RepID=A0ABD3S443_9LAMI
MGPKKFSSLFVSATALLLLVATHYPAAEARFEGVNSWCRTADYRLLCTSMVAGAATQQDASVNAMKTTLDLVRRVQTFVPRLKPAISHLEPQSQESIMETCNEDFEGKIDDIETSIKAMQSKDIGTVSTRLSAAYHSDCVDALAEFGVDCPFSKFVQTLQRQVSNCLAVVQQN